MIGKFGGAVLIDRLSQKALKVILHNLGIGMIFA
jgi:hypothetical protein